MIRQADKQDIPRIAEIIVFGKGLHIDLYLKTIMYHLDC